MSPDNGCAMKIAGMVLFFLVLSLPATAIETLPVKDQGWINTANLRLLLNSFAALGEGQVEHVLRSLKLISVTEEVQSGEWEDMRGFIPSSGSIVRALTAWDIPKKTA